MDATEHGKVILGAILGGSRSVRALDYTLARVSPDHFTDRVQRGLLLLCQSYADQTRGVLPRHALEDYLREQPPGTAELYLSYYDLVAARPPRIDQFIHSVAQLSELAAIRSTGEALAQGMEILRHGARDDRGAELRGHADARAHVLAAFAVIEREAAAGTSPEGDVRAETDKAHEAYAKARQRQLSGTSPGISTGVDELDQGLAGGLSPGDLAIIAGFTNAGKSQMCAHLTWRTCVEHQRNVVVFTSETTRSNTFIRILGRHSRHPQFGLASGLNTRDIRMGTLNPEEYEAFRAVLADFKSGPYGHCHIVQTPRGATMSLIEARLAAVCRQFAPDLVIIDYLGLIRPERARKDRREELTPILQDAKQVAVTLRNGHGVPVISPWQVSRDGRDKARQRGGYTLSDLAETAEASNTPDVILTMLEPESDDTHGRKVLVKFELLKSRDNERFIKTELLADFATSYFEQARDRNQDESVLSRWSEEHDLWPE